MFRAAVVALLLSGFASASPYSDALANLDKCAASNPENFMPCYDKLKIELDTAATKDGYTKVQIKRAWQVTHDQAANRGICDKTQKAWECRPDWFESNLIK